MRRACAAGALVVALSCAACDPAETVSAEDALEVTCVHARSAFASIMYTGTSVMEPRELARVFEIDARVLRSAGDEATAALVERTADSVEDLIGTGPDLVVFLRDDATARQRNRLEELASGLQGVQTVRFVPSEEAYERLEATDPGAAETVTPDVLPDSYEIAAVEGTDVAALHDRLDGKPGVDEVEPRGTLQAIEPVRMLGEVCELPF